MRYNIRVDLTCLDPLRTSEVKFYLNEICVTHIEWKLGGAVVFMDDWESEDLEGEMYDFTLHVWEANNDYADIHVEAHPINPEPIIMEWDAGDWQRRNG